MLLKKKNLFEEKDDDGLGNEMVEPFDPRKHAPKSRAGFFRSFLRTPKEMREKMELPKVGDAQMLVNMSCCKSLTSFLNMTFNCTGKGS